MMRLRESQKPMRPQRTTDNKNTKASSYLSTQNGRKRPTLQPTYASNISTEIPKTLGNKPCSVASNTSKPYRSHASETPGEERHTGPSNSTEKEAQKMIAGKADVHSDQVPDDLTNGEQILPTTSGARLLPSDGNTNNLTGHVTVIKASHPDWQPASDPQEDRTNTLDDHTEILEADKSVQVDVDPAAVGTTPFKHSCSVEHRVRFGDSEDLPVSQEVSMTASSSLRSGFGRPGFRNVTCPTCRKFYTARSLEFHAKACLMRKNEEMKEREALESMMQRSVKGPTRPPGKLCYICGRRYTRSSWALHESKCVEQWQAWNSRLPKQLRRGDLPFKPNISEEDIQQRTAVARSRGKANYSREDALDDIMYEASVQNALPLEYL
ncbi:unnamed protein product [Schistocephalus solidus]|uniref:Zinc finger protein 474 n=1 Tax=Schistocephalus solidus TaxID=70667 RepID=A0A183S8K4_SCHSO|nr:unnamed protein product [Schistocephalus solidus]